MNKSVLEKIESVKNILDLCWYRQYVCVNDFSTFSHRTSLLV